jgi:hypothetical protein
MSLGYLDVLKIFNNYFICLYIALTLIQFHKEIYPAQHKNFLIKITYYTIYCYSRMQLIIENIKNRLPISMIYIFFSKQKNDNNIEVVFEGKIINKINKTNINNLLSTNYDFILYSEIKNNLTYKRIIYPDNLKPDNETLFKCEPSEIKFMLTEIILGDKTVNIDFKINNNSYYVCDNIFNLNFIMYFLNKYHSEAIKDIINSNKMLNYTIDILDQNVNKITVDFKNNIKINKIDYCIF